jgi:predicted TIM-barrel fold metal-dependent hydrolase
MAVRETPEAIGGASDRIRIIDSHHHLWDLANHDYAWLARRPPDDGPDGDITPIAHDYLIPDYLHDTRAYELVKSVHVEAGWSGPDPVGETRWLQSIADVHGFPHGFVAYATLNDSDVERVLHGHRQYANTRGIRQILNWHRDPAKTYLSRPDLMKDAAWLRGFALLKKYGLRFDLQIYPSQMADAADLAAAHPDQPIILNHTGMPVDRDAPSIELWRQGMRLLSACENVCVKISGPFIGDRSWTVGSLRPFMLETIDLFGVDRVMLASNFPVDKLYRSFTAMYGAFEEVLAGFSDAARHTMFYANAERIYDL